ncbi:hypothetical protein AB0M12_34230 [Nocardia vinacea]|uniref:hypothetical protein n=1 Tax=Nocardia vinacea TaxID=96468 RepID=UPI003416848D
MSGALTTRREIRQKLSELVGVRVGLALDDARLDEFIDRFANYIPASADSVCRISVSDISRIAFGALRNRAASWIDIADTHEDVGVGAVGAEPDLCADLGEYRRSTTVVGRVRERSAMSLSAPPTADRQ